MRKVLFISFFAMAFQITLNAQKNVKVEGIQIFNGRNLDGWKGDSIYWRVENGILTGEVTPATILKKNSFIIWQGRMPENFELKVQYRISANGNSGINYRSKLVEAEPFALKGYQADIDGEDNWSGQNYEERGREFLARRGQKVLIVTGPKIIIQDNLGSKDSLQRFVKKEDWNEYHLIVKGNRMQHFINAVLMSDVTDEDSLHASRKGYLGVQVHVGPPMKIEYRNFRIKSLNKE
ncbi:MAG: 3-keto-disaccharide hydrolase [Chitinophagaceae bacterium]